MQRYMLKTALVGALLVLMSMGVPSAAAAAGPPEARLLRFPDIHKDFVVFVYGGDIWRAEVAGGPARRLTSHPGQELFPKISPDGRWIAFSAEYAGSRQVYVMPAEGGDLRQLTFYTDVGPMPPRGGYDYWVLGWSPEGKILVRANRTPFGERMGKYYLIDPKGGLEKPLPLPHGGSASLAPDGTKLAYCPVDREFRTWKRTRGGRAQDIWIFDLAAGRSQQITDYVGTDNFPMWSGEKIYFTSDREKTLNLFAYDIPTKSVQKLTHFTEFDVLWPSLGPGAIVFMNGGFLFRYDLASGQSQKLPITIGAEGPQSVPYFKNVQDNIAASSLSPAGARVVFEARGDLFTVPAKDGPTRNLTRTPGVREMSPAWSPDGKWIAYLSDATGEYEIYIRPQDGSGAPKQLTKGGEGWLFPPNWSPDSKKIAFGDRKQRLRILDVASGQITDVDRGSAEDLNDPRWSKDSLWLAYAKIGPNRVQGLILYSLADKRLIPLGDGLSADWNPVFSQDGKYIFFLSNRDFNLTFSSFEFDFLYTKGTRIFGAALDPSAPALFPIKSDEEKPKTEIAETKPGPEKTAAKAGEEAKAKPAKTETPAAPTLMKVVPEGFMARTFELPGLPGGAYGELAAVEGALFYSRQGDNGGGALFRFDFKERKEEKVLDGVGSFEISADGKKLLYRAGGRWGIADAKAGLAAGAGALDLSGLTLKIDPKAENQQIFTDGWRIFRDWFYDPNMHGVDWKLMRERYGALVPFVAHRAELDWIMGEMVGELEAGHTYVANGDEPRVPRISGAMLGCEFEADPSGRYRIGRIFAGENWDESFRSPLTEPGVDVKSGDFLLAIDGEELTTADNPFRLLEGKGRQAVTLEVAAVPDRSKARQVLVRPIPSEQNLMYIDWVKSRIALVDKLSGGKIGYMHLPNTAVEGNRALQKLFFAQTSKPALIVDDRYNGGGFIPVRIIEYLTRRTQALWARRGILPMRSPAFAHDGPKAMLANGYSSSGGDALPYWFQRNKLGPVIGTRTWGGLIGLSGNPSFVDGGSVNVPTFRIYNLEGKWVVENEGVSPDYEVVDLPERLTAGGDPSIEKAVEILLNELKKNPASDPLAPVPPDMIR